jgi:uncharacterized membrane protein
MHIYGRLENSARNISEEVTMDRVLVVVFDQVDKAFEARDALRSLDRDDDVLTVYAYAIIKKEPDGTCVVNDEHDREGLKTLLGISLGSLIGLLGGPTGVVVGSIAGTLTGITTDLDHARVSAEFVDDVSSELTPGKFALIAEINEDWTKWVDLRMEELGGALYRYTLSEVTHAEHSTDLAAMKADLALLKAEHAEARADRKAKLFERMNKLDTKIQQSLKKAKEQRELAEAQAQAKADLLKAKSARLRKEAEPKAVAHF